jgi:hypothetical protein
MFPTRNAAIFISGLGFIWIFAASTTRSLLTASFAAFDEKLQSKGQSETQRQQARRAIAIYYRLVGTIKSPPTPADDSSPKNPSLSTRLVMPNPSSADQTGLPSAKPDMPPPSTVDEPLKRAGDADSVLLFCRVFYRGGTQRLSLLAVEPVPQAREG